jgi:hypothetical protein
LEKEEYKKPKYNQIWRNHILGESILQNLLPKDKKFTEFTSITIYPEGNDYYDGVSEEYPNFLKDKNKCLFLTYEKLFDLFEKHCKEMEQPKKGQYEHWIKWMRKRYLVNFKDLDAIYICIKIGFHLCHCFITFCLYFSRCNILSLLHSR